MHGAEGLKTRSNIINYLLENFIEQHNNGTDDGIIQTLSQYFTYWPNTQQEVTLHEHGGAAIHPIGERLNGTHFPAEQLADMFLLSLQVRLRGCREEFITKEREALAHAKH